MGTGDSEAVRNTWHQAQVAVVTGDTATVAGCIAALVEQTKKGSLDGYVISKFRVLPSLLAARGELGLAKQVHQLMAPEQPYDKGLLAAAAHYRDAEPFQRNMALSKKQITKIQSFFSDAQDNKHAAKQIEAALSESFSAALRAQDNGFLFTAVLEPLLPHGEAEALRSAHEARAGHFLSTLNGYFASQGRRGGLYHKSWGSMAPTFLYALQKACREEAWLRGDTNTLRALYRNNIVAFASEAVARGKWELVASLIPTGGRQPGQHTLLDGAEPPPPSYAATVLDEYPVERNRP